MKKKTSVTKTQKDCVSVNMVRYKKKSFSVTAKQLIVNVNKIYTDSICDQIGLSLELLSCIQIRYKDSDHPGLLCPTLAKGS